MTHTVIELHGSTSHSFTSFHAERHFRWSSLKNFLYLTHAFSSSSYHFDLFSGLSSMQVSLLIFTIGGVWIGMPYMFMDFFIKQYTRKLDCNKTLNPLLRAITIGIIFQSGLCTLLNSLDLADSLRFLILSLHTVPIWSKCQKMTPQLNSTCISSEQVVERCRNQLGTMLQTTSVHIYYLKTFSNVGGSISTRFFIIAIVWIGNFFISTITENFLLKIFKFSFLCLTFTTLFVLIILTVSTKFASEAFFQMMNMRRSTCGIFYFLTQLFGIGLVGVYDFGTISPYTMVDTAVILFTLVFTVTAFARSLIIRILYLTMTTCIDDIKVDNVHYILFAILPLSAEFMKAHKIYILYLYLNLTTAMVAYLAMFTLTISRLLNHEFRSVKNIYIVGIFCILGFTLSIPITAIRTAKLTILMHGINLASLYLGSFRIATIMWIYGIENFCTDIHFWLGFKPTKYWKWMWASSPVFLFVIFIYSLQKFCKNLTLKSTTMLCILGWLIFSLAVVTIFQIKTIAKYIVRNNLIRVFRSSSKYGPPDLEDRKRRQNFNEITHNRQCTHNCIDFDDSIECNHMPLRFRNTSSLSQSTSESSMTNIF